MNFQEQYKHPLWQKKRLEVMELFSFKCCECGSVDEQLHIHHPSYKKDNEIYLDGFADEFRKDTNYLIRLIKKAF